MSRSLLDHGSRSPYRGSPEVFRVELGTDCEVRESPRPKTALAVVWLAVFLAWHVSELARGWCARVPVEPPRVRIAEWSEDASPIRGAPLDERSR